MQNNSLMNDVSKNNTNLLDTMNQYEIPTMKESERNLTFLVWNIRGITDKIFCPDLQQMLFKTDIVILTETHTDLNSEKEYDKIPGYFYKDFPRKHKHPNAPGNSGGIGIFVKCDLINGIDSLKA